MCRTLLSSLTFCWVRAFQRFKKCQRSPCALMVSAPSTASTSKPNLRLEDACDSRVCCSVLRLKVRPKIKAAKKKVKGMAATTGPPMMKIKTMKTRANGVSISK